MAHSHCISSSPGGSNLDIGGTYTREGNQPSGITVAILPRAQQTVPPACQPAHRRVHTRPRCNGVSGRGQRTSPGYGWWLVLFVVTFLLTTCGLPIRPGQAQLTEFVVFSDRIPNFARNPTIQSVQNGAWEATSTWSPARIPQASDRVLIRHTVTYNTTTGNVDTIGIDAGGKLGFNVGVNTKLRVGTLLVMPGGTLEVGTEQQPVQANVTAEILIANKPFDVSNDPAQFGTGLLAIDGTVTMSGAPKAPTFVRLTTEPTAGQTTLATAQTVLGWRQGDTMFLPDSRQLLATTSKPIIGGKRPRNGKNGRYKAPGPSN